MTSREPVERLSVDSVADALRVDILRGVSRQIEAAQSNATS